MTDKYRLHEINRPVLQTYSHVDYEITTMQLPFINPATREKEVTEMVLVRVK